MSGFKKFRDGFIGPVIILLSICLLCTWAVAATYDMTLPRIVEEERKSGALARQEVLPSADDFTQYTGIELPEGVEEAYRANNGVGFVFLAHAKGFDGEVPFMIGLDADGKIEGIKMLDNTETPGLGSKIGATDYLEQFRGQNDPGAVMSISGATKTSNALKNSLSAALSAYEQVKNITPTGEGS